MYSGAHHDAGNTVEPTLTDFNVYSVGFCYAAVCSNMGVDETLRRLDAEYPADWGVWKPAEEQFRPPKGYVCQCDQSPETHKHYLFKRERGREEALAGRYE
jgi:hypothetical protein